MNLVTVRKQEITTSSMIVAEKFGKTHQRVLRTISALYKEIQNVNEQNGPVRSTNSYTITEVSRVVRGREFKVYEMNRKMFSLLVMGFTGKDALKWKMSFLDAFDLMEQALLNQGNLEWQEHRVMGKRVRLDETSAIKLLADLATSQGSKMAWTYYINVTKLTYKALNYMKEVDVNLRDTLSIAQLYHLQKIEQRAIDSITYHVGQGEHYKEVYVNVKNEINSLATELLMYDGPRLESK